MPGDVGEVLISEDALKRRITVLAREISHVYADTPRGITMVAVLAGSLIFLADLIRRLPMKMRIGLMTVSSYAGATTESRGAVLGSVSLPDLRGRDVLIVDDILDTGRTLALVQTEVRRAKPRTVRTVVLLRKPGKAPPEVTVDFTGFDIDDVFVVGFGLDYDGLYRNLPHVAVLSSNAQDLDGVT